MSQSPANETRRIHHLTKKFDQNLTAKSIPDLRDCDVRSSKQDLAFLTDDETTKQFHHHRKNTCTVTPLKQDTRSYSKQPGGLSTLRSPELDGRDKGRRPSEPPPPIPRKPNIQTKSKAKYKDSSQRSKSLPRFMPSDEPEFESSDVALDKRKRRKELQAKTKNHPVPKPRRISIHKEDENNSCEDLDKFDRNSNTNTNIYNMSSRRKLNSCGRSNATVPSKIDEPVQAPVSSPDENDEISGNNFQQESRRSGRSGYNMNSRRRPNSTERSNAVRYNIDGPVQTRDSSHEEDEDISGNDLEECEQEYRGSGRSGYTNNPRRRVNSCERSDAPVRYNIDKPVRRGKKERPKSIATVKYNPGIDNVEPKKKDRHLKPILKKQVIFAEEDNDLESDENSDSDSINNSFDNESATQSDDSYNEQTPKRYQHTTENSNTRLLDKSENSATSEDNDYSDYDENFYVNEDCDRRNHENKRYSERSTPIKPAKNKRNQIPNVTGKNNNQQQKLKCDISTKPQFHEDLEVNEIEKRQYDRKERKRGRGKTATSQQENKPTKYKDSIISDVDGGGIQQRKNHKNPNVSDEKKSRTPTATAYVTFTKSETTSKQTKSYQRSRSASDGIGLDEFSKRQKILRDKFGGVVAQRKSVIEVTDRYNNDKYKGNVNSAKYATENRSKNIRLTENEPTYAISSRNVRHSVDEASHEHWRRHSSFEPQIEGVVHTQRDGDQGRIQFTEAYYQEQEELVSDDFSGDSEPEEVFNPSIPRQHDRVYQDSDQDTSGYEEPYSIINIAACGPVPPPQPPNDKEKKGQKSFKFKKFGTFGRRKKQRASIPEINRVMHPDIGSEPSFNTDNTFNLVHAQNDTEKTEKVFEEIIKFVRQKLEEVTVLDKLYVQNAALDPKNGILQEGEHRRLFGRIPKLIKYLTQLLNDLEKCTRNDSQICQYLLDVVTYDESDKSLNIFMDYTVNSRFQDNTLRYLRRQRVAFVQIVKSQETPSGRSSVSCRQNQTLDYLIKQPCFFILTLTLHIKRLQQVIKKTNHSGANVVRLAYDLLQNMNRLNNECEDRDMKLEEKEEQHVSKILLKMDFEYHDDVMSSEEMEISNESWVESWNEVIIYSSKKGDGKDWKKAGSNVKLVTFERLVMIINVKQHKADGQNEEYYKFIDCANKNYVEIENPSSKSYPFKVPVRRGSPMNVFLMVLHKDKTSKKRMYYVCWEPSNKRNNFESWRRNLTVPSGDNGEQYAVWSRPKYEIVVNFSSNERGDLEVKVGDEVEIIEKREEWVRAENLSNRNMKGWIPKTCLGNEIPSVYRRGINRRQHGRIGNDGRTNHSVIVKKGRKQERHK